MKTFCSSKTFRHLQAAAFEGRPDLQRRHPRSLFESILEQINQINKRDTRGDNDHGPKFVELFEYICVFATLLKIDLHQAIIWKYPGVCSYCVKSVCECSTLLFRPQKASDETLGPFRLKAINWNVARFVRADSKVYQCHKIGGIAKLWRHLLSEAVELAGEFSKTMGGSSKALAVEVGDLCERIINLCSALQIDLVGLWNARYGFRATEKRKRQLAAS